MTVRRATDADLWLYKVLHRGLHFWFGCVVLVLIGVVASWPSRPITSIGEVPWWAPVVGLLVVGATWTRVSGCLGRSVHHLLYGQHDDAYEVVDRVYRHLHAEPGSDDLLPTLAAAVADTLKLPFVAIHAGPDEPGAVQASGVHGAPPAHVEMISIALRHEELTLGSLEVSPRRSGDRLSAADLRLLGDLARHVGITLYAARLSEALQTSREQLVTAREEERRRIRRDLHDGLGPTLASLRMQLTALQRTLRLDPEAAERLVGELRDDVRGATAEVRRLVYELRPPMLDELGLVGALRHLGPIDDRLTRSVEAPPSLPPLPAALEVAIYRIAAEALHNTVRHARATHCELGLSVTDAVVTLTVTDDGCGLPADYLAGVGHMSMHERATELGGRLCVSVAPAGGTCVTASFPVQVLP